MKKQFTKGEWIADLRSGCCAVYPKKNEGDTNGCHQYDKRNIFYSNKGCKYDEKNGYWTMSQEEQANAQLISAAPDLFEALINIENDDNRIPATIWEMRNKALNKALGEEYFKTTKK